MSTILIYPPFADPTQPYISLPVLKGYLKANNFDINTLDLNIEGLSFIFSKLNIDHLTKKLHDKFNELNNKKTLSFTEQFQYKKILEVTNNINLYKNIDPLKIIKNISTFYNFKMYNDAKNCLEHYFDIINALYFPYQFGFNRANHFALAWNFDLLHKYFKESASPLKIFYENRLNRELLKDKHIAGISLTFVSQLPEAFYIAQHIKKINPDIFLVAGGTCISQIINNADDETKRALFTIFDAVCYAEGEETLLKLCQLAREHKKISSKNLSSVPNLLTLDPENKIIIKGEDKTFDLKNAELPDYSDFDLDSYMAPEKLLLYPPARGCYWNRCSFCDYGFNGHEKHCYKEIDPVKAVSDIETLSTRYNVKNFYLSCDVLSPKYAVNFAQNLINNNMKINWSCDLRIEKNYNEGNCEILKNSGMTSAAFGIEGGSDRVLQMMNKGINRDTIIRINKNFHDAGIATQWMTFTFHPGENTNDALKTINLIDTEFDNIDLFITGEFGLTAGSLIIKNPAGYGIDKIYYTLSDQFKIYPLYHSNTREYSLNERDIIDEKLDSVSIRYALSHYPWAGAISTNHTMLYFLKYGQRAFVKLKKEKRVLSKVHNNLKTADIKFPVKAINGNIDKFYSLYLVKALTPKPSGKNSFNAELGAGSLESWMKKFNLSRDR